MTITQELNGQAEHSQVCFIEIFIAAWEIWKLRNEKFFEGQTHLSNFGSKDSKILLHIHRMQENLKLLVSQWVGNIL
jgi:hypothetical protein